jgi:hypothetical protein
MFSLPYLRQKETDTHGKEWWHCPKSSIQEENSRYSIKIQFLKAMLNIIDLGMTLEKLRKIPNEWIMLLAESASEATRLVCLLGECNWPFVHHQEAKLPRRGGRWYNRACWIDSVHGAMLCGKTKVELRQINRKTAGNSLLDSQVTLQGRERQLLLEREAVSQSPSVWVNWIIHWN